MSGESCCVLPVTTEGRLCLLYDESQSGGEDTWQQLEPLTAVLADIPTNAMATARIVLLL